MNGQLIILSLRSTITNPTVIAIAVVVLALVVAVGGFLVYRSGGKKSKAASSAVNNDWQRQMQGQQQGQPGGWNQQGMNNDAPAWAPQGQGQPGGWNNQNGQQGWNAQQQNGQMPQQNASPWNAQQGSQSWGDQGMPQQSGQSWGDQGMPQQQQQQGGWGNGMQNGGNQWAAAANPGQPSANQWDAQNNQNSVGGRWDAAPAQGQPSSVPQQQQWGGQAANMPQQQAPNSFGGGSGSSWNQQGLGGASPNGQNAQMGQGMDGWGSPQQQQYAQQGANNSMGGFGAVPQAPAWQQQQGGFNQQGMQPNPGAPFGDGGFGMNDGDKTIMRPPAGLGLVRVEEGKEPGREYKIVKEALSIGRSRESDIFLEDLAVSRLHASVVNQGNGQYALKDEGSANGTKVNGQLVGKFQIYPLQEGDRIQLGQTVLVFARS